MDEAKRASLKKVEVAALRVPFDGAVAYTHSGIARPQNTLLFLISQAAVNQVDFTIFNSVLVQGMLQWKWESYAESIFFAEFTLFMMHLLFVCVFSYFSSLTAAYELEELVHETSGLIVIGTFPFALIGSLFFMSLEIRQLLLDGLRGTWMYLDLCTFGAQLVVDVLFLFRSPLLEASLAGDRWCG
jgi:hypothetical protein